MSPVVAPWLYWLRLRRHPIQELLAAIGIATGVALLFAVQVANSSVTGSVEQLVHGITGDATMQVTSRAPGGFDASLLSRVTATPGVKTAAPMLIEQASVTGPHGRQPVSLVGVTLDVGKLHGQLLRGFGVLDALALSRGLLVPASTANAIGVGDHDRVGLQTFGQSIPVPISTVLGPQAGALSGSPFVVGSLALVQGLTGLRGKITTILVEPQPGQDAAVRTALERLAGGRLDVVASDNETELVRQAAGPNEQSTGMFAAVSALVGILFTFNAMLLTVPERRRLIAELRSQGFGRGQLAAMLAFEALVLGVVASLLGLLLGDVLSRHLFHSDPGYLSFAFPIGSQRIVSFADLAIAFSAGIVATLVAASRPLFDLFSRRPLDEVYRDVDEPGEGIRPRTRRIMLAVAAGLVGAVAAVEAIAPSITVVALGALALAMLMVLPAALAGVTALAEGLTIRLRHAPRLLTLSVGELRTGMTRAIALAATGALAVFGSVAIEGAHRDLLRGLDDNQASYLRTADVWITSGGDENSLTTTSFHLDARQRAALNASPDVAATRDYYGTLLDTHGHRVWISARDPGDDPLVPPRQLLHGDPRTAARDLRAGGWAVVSASLARALGARIGQPFTLPTPSGPARLRLAATSTNLGWSPGTIVLNAHDYVRLWNGPPPSGVEVDLKPGVAPLEGRRAVQATLGPGSPLTVETSAERLTRFERLSRQALDRLRQISLLVLIAAALAMAAAFGGAVWQRRRRLAELRLHGSFYVTQVWATLLVESGLILLVGSTVGAAFGLYGQSLATRWVSRTTGFPAIFSPAVGLACLTFAGVAAVALVIVSVPGYLAARAPLTLAFEGD